MAGSTIGKQLIDLNLFSGSSDTFRTAIGGFWRVSSGDDAETSFEQFTDTSPITGFFDKVENKADDQSLVEVLDATVMLPNRRFPVRIYGDSTTVKNDQFWKTIFLGGTFGAQTLPTLYNEDIFSYRYTSWEAPYPRLSSSILSSFAFDEIQISYDYHKYLPNYQDYGNNVESELLMPNYYILNDLSTYNTYEEDIDLYDVNLLNLVTREGTYEEVNNLLDINYDELLPILDNVEPLTISNFAVDLSNYTYLNTTYLTSSLPQVPLSASTTVWAKDRLKNILLDRPALDKLYVEDSIESYSDQFPYYIKISFPIDGASDFSDSIQDNDFSSKFIKTLYQSFSDRIDTLVPSSSQVAITENYYSGTVGSDVLSNINTTTATTVRALDYPTMLSYCHNTFSSSADGCFFVGGRNLARDSATIGGSGAYRYFNSVSAAGVLSDTINYLNNSANFDITDLTDIYGNNDSTIETLAYRIEKSFEGETLQNYWIMNSNMQDFNFFDTQVKYNSEYTYTVYAYRLILGFKYGLSNLLLTRQLSCTDSNDEFGLEFYDPQSDDESRADALYLSDLEKTSSSGAPAATIQMLNELATLAQTTSEYPYLADMYMNYGSSLEIVEIPVFTKTLKIVDNPANEVAIRPYQIIDNSQTIGFEISLGAFAKKTYPTPIAPQDEITKQQYLDSNDLLSIDNLPRDTVAPPRFIEVYRLSEKPTSIADFDGSLISTVDAQIPDSKYSYTFKWFENIIKTNQKYYYLFRILNAQSTVGHISEIYESELINDGGYLYNVFNVLREEELQQEIFNNPTKTFKKLLQIRPRYNQIELDTTDLEFTQKASSQVANLKIGSTEDLIWNRTFKNYLWKENI